VYFFVGVVGFGGLGIWIEWVKYEKSYAGAELSGLITAVLTFFPALVGSTSIQWIFAITTPDRTDKTIVAFALFSFSLFMMAAILLAVFTECHEATVLSIGILCSAIAAWVWCLSASDDETYKRKPRPDAATGGSTNRDLPGSLHEYKY
jgi:hypothetical protein